MKVWEEMIGKKYGRLTVIRKAPKGTKDRVALVCDCECGNQKIIRVGDIRSRKTKSCGCLRIEVTSKRFTKQGDTSKRLYSIWAGMKGRCSNKNIEEYKNYGGRGISVCEEWEDYPTFKSWAISSGYKSYLTIERVDVNGNYTSENCTWILSSLQNRNCRNTTRYTIGEENKPLVEWCEIFNVPLSRAHKRVYLGVEPFTVEELYKRIRSEVI